MNDKTRTHRSPPVPDTCHRYTWCTRHESPWHPLAINKQTNKQTNRRPVTTTNPSHPMMPCVPTPLPSCCTLCIAPADCSGPMKISKTHRPHHTYMHLIATSQEMKADSIDIRTDTEWKHKYGIACYTKKMQVNV